MHKSHTKPKLGEAPGRFTEVSPEEWEGEGGVGPNECELQRRWGNNKQAAGSGLKKFREETSICSSLGTPPPPPTFHRSSEIRWPDGERRASRKGKGEVLVNGEGQAGWLLGQDTNYDALSANHCPGPSAPHSSI